MPDTTAQAPDGTKHVFPDGTDPAVIDRTMKQYITGQTAAQAPAAAPAPASTPPMPGVIQSAGQELGGQASGLLHDLYPNKSNMYGLMGIGGVFSPLKSAIDAITNWQRRTQDNRSVPYKLLTGATEAAGIPTGAAGEEQEAARGNPSGVIGHALTPALETVLGSALSGISGKGTVQEVMGEGATKARMLSDQHAHALATQQHLQGLAESVHSDAQSAMSTVLQKVDAAHPDGVFDKAEIQDKVRSAVGDLVKVPEKMPPSVARILKEEKPTWENLATERDTSGFVQRLRDSGLSDVELRETLRNQGFGEREIASMTEGGGPGADKLTAEQLKQMRSDVGQELSRYGNKGTVGAALKSVYGVLSDQLRGAAKDAGVERDWLTANSKYTQYANDFTRGPLKRTLQGATASSIMEPLTGNTRMQVLDTLQKYRDAGFNIDMDTLNQEMKRYGMGKTVNRLSQPTKMDLLMAGFSPKALAIRQLGPRLMRNPSALNLFAGKGFDADAATLNPRQVYPTKAAAMKAAKEPVAPSSGASSALESFANKMHADIADLERQRAATTDPAKRAQIEESIWERLNARKRNVGPPRGTPERRR